jgi:hypothetical protein
VRKPAITKSKLRLTTKSKPSRTGGLTSSSGTPSPGTSSVRRVSTSIVVGATQTRTPWVRQRSTSSTARS